MKVTASSASAVGVGLGLACLALRSEEGSAWVTVQPSVARGGRLSSAGSGDGSGRGRIGERRVGGDGISAMSSIRSSGGSSSSISRRRKRTALLSTRAPTEGGGGMKEMSAQMRDMRADMEADPQMAAMMKAMRGAGIQDYDQAGSGEMRLIGTEGGDDAVGGERLPTAYSADAIAAFFSKRKGLVVQRGLQLAGAFSGFAFAYLKDIIAGTVEENEVKRTILLRETITSLGPFYIKLGQALSIRPDILSPASMVELQRLCDKVPSFDSKIAFETIRKEFGCEIDEVYSEITPEPLAAASLGQVYKATLKKDGSIVAVKVQRPGVLETVSLDLYLARELGMFLRTIPALAERTDLVALLDEFAFRFYDELDYVKECANGIQIREDMKDLPIMVPINYPEFTRRRVFTTQWIEGEKLSQSKADDVQELVNIGVISYLTQLLDTGFFHADPHPGNLIRTPSGELCLLDFGLMCEVTDDQKYGMIEAISHLVHRDYSRIGEDFKQLDFIPKDVDVTPVVPALERVFDAALAGGGAKSINFNALAADLAQITFDYPFRLPPYFALIIRAIGVLEGIALVGNPGFAIIDEAYPYLSKRLLTDESPRLRAALRYMIYGKSNVFDVERLLDLLSALETFSEVKTVAAAGAAGGSPTPNSAAAGAEGAEAAKGAREALKFLFSPEGEFFREFISDEVVKGVDCLSRDAARELAFTVGLRGPRVPQVFRALAPSLDTDERKVVDNTRRLISFLLGDLGGATGDGKREQRTPYNPAQGLFGLTLRTQGGGTGPNLVQELQPVLREQGPVMRTFGLQIVGRLTEKLATRVLRFTSDSVLGNYYGEPDLQAGQLGIGQGQWQGQRQGRPGQGQGQVEAVKSMSQQRREITERVRQVPSPQGQEAVPRPRGTVPGSAVNNTRFAREGAAAAR